MHTFVLIMYILGALAFAVSAVVARSLIAAGLLCWLLVYLVPLLAK